MTEKPRFRAVVDIGHAPDGKAPGSTAVYPEALQVSICIVDDDDRGWGRRLVGPKYGGVSTNFARVELDADDADEIRRILDAAFPPATAAVRP